MGLFEDTGGSGDLVARQQRTSPARTYSAVSVAVGVLAIGGLILGIVANRADIVAAGPAIRRTLWILPGLVALHLSQLWLAAIAWRALFVEPRPPAGAFYRLRIIREGIDSLLPVAQIGGEIVGARLLSRRGVVITRAAASVIVDVTIELLTQVIFLALGLCAVVWLSRTGSWSATFSVVFAAVAVAAAFVLAQRIGLLRLLEGLLRGIARRWPALGGTALDGLHSAAFDFYRRRAALLRSTALHLVAWMLGSLESWAVLHALGIAVTPLQAFAIESLGMAGRSAGFAIPAALGAQEGGFALAAAAIGLPIAPALVLSLIKRLREGLVGGIGLALWRLASRRATPG